MKRLEPRGDWKYRWEMPSSSDPNKTYVVAMSHSGDWACGCIGWTRHMPRKDCRHITRVKQVEPRVDAAGQKLQGGFNASTAKPKTAPAPKALTLNKFAAASSSQLRDLEKQLKVNGGRDQAAPKPEPFFVLQTRRAITLED